MHTLLLLSIAQARKLCTQLFGGFALVCVLIGPAHGQQHAIYHFSPGDWGGMHEASGTALLFEAVRSQLTRLRISNFNLGCTTPKGNYYDWPVTLSQRQTDPFPFLIDENGRFNGGFEIDPRDLAYGGLEVNMQGHLQGATGTVTIWMKSLQPDGVKCDGTIRNFSVRKLPRDIPRIPEPSTPGFPGFTR